MRIGIVTAHPRDGAVLLQAVGLRPEHHVIWVAATGASAVELSAKETPDLILMSLLDGIEGIEATRRIMASTPCAILVVAASVLVDAARVFAAMGHGAMDAADMPASGSPEHTAPLLGRLAIVSCLIGEKAAPSVSRSGDHRSPFEPAPLVAIGASSGGPAAVAEVLRGLPGDFPAAIVVIQHLDEKFTRGMADWLNQQSGMPVRVAAEGERLVSGTVLIAGTSDHLALTSAHRLGYTVEPRHSIHRPSVDVFFESVSRRWRGAAVGVLLTGMGADGARGLKGLRARGHHTIAQDQGTSAVYGMPKAAATMNAAVDILPMDRIAARLIEVIAGLPVVARATSVPAPIGSGNHGRDDTGS